MTLFLARETCCCDKVESADEWMFLEAWARGLVQRESIALWAVLKIYGESDFYLFSSG